MTCKCVMFFFTQVGLLHHHCSLQLVTGITIIFLDYYGKTTIHELEIIMLIYSIKFCFLSGTSNHYSYCFFIAGFFYSYFSVADSYSCYRRAPVSQWQLTNCGEAWHLHWSTTVNISSPSSFLVFLHKQLTLLFVDISMSTTLHKLSSP